MVKESGFFGKGQSSKFHEKKEEATTEDERFIILNDPDLNRLYKYAKKGHPELMSTKEDISSFLTTMGRREELEEEYKELTETEKGRDILEELSDDYNNFENRDILAEMSAELKEKKEEKAKQEAEELEGLEAKTKTITFKDFEFLEQAYKFQEALKASPLLEKSRPTFEDGKPLNDRQIEDYVKQYKEYQKLKKEGKDLPSYPEKDFDLMKKCSLWFFIVSDIKEWKKAEEPKFKGDEPLTPDQLRRAAQEYLELQKQHSRDFAEFKVETGQWQKKKFDWKEKEFEGVKQLVSYEDSTVIREGKEVKGPRIKYILVPMPENFQIDQNQKDNYFTIKKTAGTKDGNLILAFVDLKSPYVHVKAPMLKKKPVIA